MASLRSLLVLVALLTVRAFAQCVSYGIDYANNGQYYVDASSNQYFSFVTVFQGCAQETINPILTDPSGNQYSCSSINTMPAGTQVTSTCGIPFSAMKSGSWKIILSGNQVQVQRTMTLTVGLPETTTLIATPTVVIGITSTPRAITVQSTLQQTVTLILVPATLTAACQGATQTVTNYNRAPTLTLTTTVVRTQTDQQRTSTWATTVTTQAVCHYPTRKRELAERSEAAMLAQTVTYTQTTYTVTQTIVSTVAPRTTTEVVFRTITATVQPAPQTICQGGGRPGQVVTVTVQQNQGATATQTNVIYQTSHLTGTIWIGTTQYSTISNAASATACWRAGGWYGV